MIDGTELMSPVSGEGPPDPDGMITHPKYRAWLRLDDIVQCVWIPGITAELADAQSAMDDITKLCGGQPRPVLVDMPNHGTWDRVTRAEWGRPSAPIKALALVIGTPLSRTVVNLYLRMNPPPYPLRMFDTVTSATTWLGAYV